MNERLQDRMIAFAAGLLRQGPSTYKDDFPHVPRYYRHLVADNLEFSRKAAICMREGIDEIKRLEAALSEIRALPDEWVADCMNFKCTGKCSNAKCAAQLQAILEKYDGNV